MLLDLLESRSVDQESRESHCKVGTQKRRGIPDAVQPQMGAELAG